MHGLKYVLVLRGDLSCDVWLFPYRKADRESMPESLMQWIAAFRTIQWLVSDQGPHFEKGVHMAVKNELWMRYHFMTAYLPWANWRR